ncbi:MAG TPA: hypothetical protein VFW03_28740 [Gemmatimonadaceae bacterium]|nr:hypothetical protein [Gemmatimonadaceae bacterium]
MVPSLTSRFERSRLASALTAVTAAIAFLAAAPVSRASAQRVLTVVAHDTSLESSPTVPAGITTVRLALKGKSKRELVVHRVPAGTTPEESARAAAGRPERWFHDWSFGGPSTPRDSTSDASATLDLRPGRYVLVAYEVDPSGRPRGDRFIWREVAVIAGSVLIPARFPVPDLTMRIKSGQIDVSGVVRTGQRVVQVENAGGVPHDALIGRLKPGKTLDDVRRWDRDRTDPAPFVYVGGLTPMSSGFTAQTRLVLQTGMHVVLCTMRHAGQRERDYQRGMLASFKVN